LTSLEGEAARNALLRKQVDAIFLTGDSASTATLRELVHTDGIRLFEFPQADAYVRRFAYLSKLTLPAGAFDLGENLPPENMSLLAGDLPQDAGVACRTGLHTSGAHRLCSQEAHRGPESSSAHAPPRRKRLAHAGQALH
jgi:hypothetical protein